MLGKAQGLLLDAAFRSELGEHLTRSRECVLRDWLKLAKDDVVLRVRNGGNREAMQAAFVSTDEFQERWKVKTREQMAEFEWKKRCMTLRIKDEEARVTAGEKEAAAASRAKQKEHKEWDKEDRREKRGAPPSLSQACIQLFLTRSAVGGWRDFMGSQQGKKRKGELAGFKGPALKPEEAKTAAKFGGPKDEKRVERPDEVRRAW